MIGITSMDTDKKQTGGLREQNRQLKSLNKLNKITLHSCDRKRRWHFGTQRMSLIYIFINSQHNSLLIQQLSKYAIHIQ